MPIPANIQQHIFDLLNKTSNVSFVSADKVDVSALKLSPGQIVTAEVVSLLPYNRAEVTIGTARLNLELPISVRVGQNLELTYVADEPRPTFAMPHIGEAVPPVKLSDASRLLGMLIGNNQMTNPEVRASLLSVSQLLHQTDGDNSLLGAVLDEALTYTPQKAEPAPLNNSSTPLPQDKTAKTSFENNASQILQQIARNARFTLVEAVNQPLSQLPLMPGEEVDASITGTLPGGRVFVQIAGTTLELVLPHAAPKDSILRLTYLSSLPKPLFALQRQVQNLPSGSLSEASRWLSVLEHSQGGVSGQQMNVLERLNTIISSLPPDSPAFTAIRDEALTYSTLKQTPSETLSASVPLFQQQQPAQSGNGIVLHDDMAKLLQALIRGNRLALLEAINQQAMPTGLQPGQQIRADVLATLGGGRFMLDVAGKAMEFTMPKGIVVGNRLQMFFITSEPRPTFLLARFGSDGDSTVSNTGRWIGNLLENPLEGDGVIKTPGIMSLLLGEPPLDASNVSQSLEKNLKDSGLFYESHLNRWFGGEYSLEDLLKEPQGQLSTLKQMIALNQSAVLPDEALQLVKGSPEQSMAQALVRQNVSSSNTEKMADTHTLPLVQDQLATLQSGQLLFKGELFSGHQMEWGIHQKDSNRKADGSTERSWKTTLTLDMPTLGGIKADITLQEGTVSVRINVAKETTEKKLEQGASGLKEQFEAAGLPIAEIRILHEKQS